MGLIDAWGHPFKYTKLGNANFEVRSAGLDGAFGTKDDLTVSAAESRMMDPNHGMRPDTVRR